ncbi:hypothetical protein Fleli_3246 [Bernardetia litoralis DSM 6794]|uniref:Uncharacterized protein n=1 Tax=Bernardetia litoralis (strain ATCC 23117 / DSM 6794 / NBRC 15988 / NCIMB 1366 / Fx l1 / Sio-4) TaxID=880071 RepID=I4ANP2_BERLS|nr:hypothetical protein [Bernardetia litoralis]AFM05577.1 hypothetical protein Fleli_3246 [Bernardetia litoralis DSM 6794]
MKTTILSIFFFILFSFFSFASAQMAHVELEELIEKQQVKINARGLGGYFGKKLLLNIYNTYSKPLLVKISAGTIFTSEDEHIQDLMILEDYQFAIQKGATKMQPVLTACIQATNGSPYKNALYNFDRLDTKGLSKVAQTIAKFDYQSDYTAQASVWCVSNNKKTAYLSNPKQEIFENLAKAVCQAKGEDFDKIEFKAQEKYIPTFTFNGYLQTFLEENQQVNIEVYDAQNKLLKIIIENQEAKAGFFYRSFLFTQQIGEEAIFKVKLVNAINKKVLAEQEVNKNSIAHNEDMKLIESENKFIFVLDEPTKLNLALYDDQNHLFKTYFTDKEYNKSSQTVINIRHNVFIPKSGTYFLVAKDENGKEIGRERVYTDGHKIERKQMLVQRHNFSVNLVDPVSGASLDVFDKYGNKVANILENSALHHGYRIIPTVFKHYLGHGQTFYLRMTDKNGILIKEDIIEGK